MPSDLDPLDPAPLEEHETTPLSEAEMQWDFTGVDNPFLNPLQAMLKNIGLYILNRLKESTTWLGVIVSYLGIPAVLTDPVEQIVVGTVTILVFFLKREGTETLKEETAKASA